MLSSIRPTRSRAISFSTRRPRRVAAIETIADVPLAVGAGAAVIGLGSLYFFTDPQKRREVQMQQTGGNEKDSVRDYFNGEGFNRWKKIYGTVEDVNDVQKDIRDGHAVTIEKVVKWLTADKEDLKGMTVCDAGCGTGSLAIPLSLLGADVTASDISSAMVEEAKTRLAEASQTTTVSGTTVFETSDLEKLTGSYDTVTCLDVMIHYPQDKADDMIGHLASLSKDRLIVSFAPKTVYYSILKRIGELFPGPSKATRAYLHAASDVEASLNKAGFQVKRRELTATKFYFSQLLDAVRT